MITQQDALKYFTYDPETGIVRNRVYRGGASKAGDISGCQNPDGYWQIKYQFKIIKLHSLIWLMMYGEIGVLLDHINGDPSDNRLANLRKCTVTQNAQNKKARTNSSSNGIKGISWDSRREKWQVFINVFGDVKFLGRYIDKHQAGSVYAEAAKKYFGEFART